MGPSSDASDRIPPVSAAQHLSRRSAINEDNGTSSPESTRTIFQTLQHALHRVAISRIALIPVIHASSVQRDREANANSSVSRTDGGERDADEGTVAMETSDLKEKSGWDRIREGYRYNDADGFSRELYELVMMFILGGMLGFVYGGFPASRHARKRYIQSSQAAIYHSKLEATGSSYNAASRGMIRYGFRWGWRTAMIAGGYHGIAMTVAMYRDKQDLLCYSVAGVTTGMLFRMNLGLRGMVGGAFIGGLLGIPSGALLLGFQYIMGETSLEKYRRLRLERSEERAREMSMRMQVTPQMMDLMEESIQRGNQLLEEKKQVELTSSTTTPS
ncbi:complex I assembly factor TIMMDC1, mitochondrial-like [Diadema antillarum]|uniref:complex I assembly factor TIMMDC1, mitochondrial-like n=1 Tax=Diadema antillarum TaxID=105358 RepID=UPI003A872DEF